MTWLRVWVFALIALYWVAAPRPASGGGPPPLVIGVQTHFGFTTPRPRQDRFLRWVEQSGLRSSRDEMFWHHVQDASGTLSITRGAATTQAAWRSAAPPFEPLLILNYGHPSYDEGSQPRSPEAIEAFTRYAQFVVTRSAPEVRMVEVWNEWNLKAGAKPKGTGGDPVDYARLAAATYRAVKAVRPEVRVLVGGMGDDYPDWAWLRKSIAHGLLDHADGLSVHLYNHCLRPGRLGADEMLARLDRLREVLDAAGRPALPIYVTEVGWPTHTGRCGVPEDAAARHSVRFLLGVSQRPWMGGVWFYEFVDGGSDPGEREHRFGLHRRDGTEKPAGCMLRELGATLQKRPLSVMRQGDVTLARYAHGQKDRWFVWARSPGHPLADDHSVRLSSQNGSLRPETARAVCGVAGELSVSRQGREASLSFAPESFAVLDTPAGDRLTLEEEKP